MSTLLFQEYESKQKTRGNKPVRVQKCDRIAFAVPSNDTVLARTPITCPRTDVLPYPRVTVGLHDTCLVSLHHHTDYKLIRTDLLPPSLLPRLWARSRRVGRCTLMPSPHGLSASVSALPWYKRMRACLPNVGCLHPNRRGAMPLMA